MERSQQILAKVWICIRFVVFGLAGFQLMFYGVLCFLQRVFEGRPQFEKGTDDVIIGLSPLLSLPLGLVGTMMVLFGVGELKRWRYSLVFLSMPVSLYASLRLCEYGADRLSQTAGLSQTTMAIVVCTVMLVCASGTYTLVRRYYDRTCDIQSRADEHNDSAGWPPAR
jgi:hypothetical protein